MIPEFLLNLLNKQYGKETTNIILDGYSKKRPVTIRINTLKSNAEGIKKELETNKIAYTEVKWYENALILNNINEKQIQELEIYKDGKIYMQSLSSMLPPLFLEPKDNQDILDMTAAPGSKTTQIAMMTNNKAHITACEINKIREERLKYNIEKQGATCVYVMQKDASRLDDFFAFDKILLDAPCSGSGTLDSNLANLDKTFTLKLIERSIVSQKKLINKAIKLLKSGGEMIYSTCSILEDENEKVIDSALNSNLVELVPLNIEEKFNMQILGAKINGTLCTCPNELYEGFFIAKLRKK